MVSCVDAVLSWVSARLLLILGGHWMVAVNSWWALGEWKLFLVVHRWMLVIPGFWVDMHRTCMLNKSNAKQSGASLNPDILPRHHYNEPRRPHGGHCHSCMPLVSVSIFAKGKEKPYGASPHHHGNEEKETIFQR